MPPPSIPTRVTGITEARAHEIAVDIVETVLEFNKKNRERSTRDGDNALVEDMKLEDHEVVALRLWVERQGLHRIT